MAMTWSDVSAWCGPDLSIGRLKETIGTIHDIQAVVAHSAFEQGRLQLAVWPATAQDTGLGPFGRLRALRSLQWGEPLPQISCSVRPFYKCAVYTPKDVVDKVSRAMWDAGAGHVGRYSHTRFVSAAGETTFYPEEGAHPFLGQSGEMVHTVEMKIEMIIPHWLKSTVHQAIVAAHPYEEPAVDWIRLDNALNIPQIYVQAKEWRAGEWPVGGTALAMQLKPQSIVVEKMRWSDRIVLEENGIAVTIVAPGTLLLKGLDNLLKARQWPWE
ncbi:MAG: hypothetical protein OWS74_03235 [Firmicutes bacterium]|nr:hypothetical protein [Bacillota bacterium]